MFLRSGVFGRLRRFSLPQEIPSVQLLQPRLELRPGEQTLTENRSGSQGRARELLSEELDTSAIVQRDDFSLVLLLQGLQGTEQHRLIQAVELFVLCIISTG